MARVAWVVLGCVVLASPVWGQGVFLGEDSKPGQIDQFDLALTVEGKLKVERNGRLDAISLRARASHSFAERIEAADARGGAGRVLRHYLTATSESEVGNDRSKRDLGKDRRLIVAQRTTEGALNFSLDGPLSREELELVAEHFDTLCLAGLLPGRELKPGETWKVAAEAIQYACLFEGLIKSEVVGTLTDVKEGIARFTLTGTAEGVEAGAQAKVTISAQGTFDVAAKRTVALSWEQTDERSQGPATPASEVRAVLTLKRMTPTDEPKELAAEVRARVPAEDKIPGLLLQLRHVDPEGRYEFVYSRDWHIVGRTKDHLVMRLLDRGEFTAQATLTMARKVEAGKHTDPGEFKKLLALVPGWVAESVRADGVVPTEAGRWLYRVATTGKQDGVPVIQNFHLLAGPQGDQIMVSVLAPQDRLEKLANRDLALVNAIDFPTKK